MNILLSYQWLKEYVTTKKSPRELAKLLSLHSMSVERVLPEVDLLSDKIVLGEILEVNPHPNADRLKLAVVSTGKEKFNVVCGAPNINVGMKIAFAKSGAMVRWHGEGDPVELQPAKVRGIESFGMICDDSEIGLAKEINPAGVTDYSHLKAKVGTPMAEALKLDDTIMDIEITTNRIDAASTIGMAREVSAMTGEKFSDLKVKVPAAKGEKKPLKITIEDKEKCFGFHGVVLADAKVGPSPEWLKRRLLSAGHSSFNNVVDITNYVMRELGHPLHAFDYDKIDGGQLIIRAAKKDEKLVTLDGKTETLQPFMAVVADKKQPQALAGVMGGDAAKITEGTTTILLEAASWNPATIRKTMKKLDKFSDAGGYFNKGVSPQLAETALKRAIELICEVTGARVASPIVSQAPKYKPATVKMAMANAEKVIGAKLKDAQVKKWLDALGFEPKIAKGIVTCKVPHWRQFDVAIEEDIIEEVARMYGYQNIANALPSGEMPVPEINAEIEYTDKLKSAMQGAGCTELYTYSMVSEALLKLGKRQVENAIKLLNPLDADHMYMRTRLLPSVLEIAAQNQGVVGEQHIYEIANVYTPVKANDLPDEHLEMAGVIVAEDLEDAFREGKGLVLHLLKQLGLDKAAQWTSAQTDLTKPNESLTLTIDGKEYGSVGVVRNDTAQAVGLKKPAVAFELALRDLIKMAKTEMSYQPVPKFPPIELDLSVTVAGGTPWGKVEETAMKAGMPLLKRVELFDIYDHDDGAKSFGFHLEYRSDEKTLEMKEVEAVQDKVVKALEEQLQAKLRA